MITLDHAYLLVGLMFLAFAVLTLGDRAHPTRIRSAVFWGLIAVSMLLLWLRPTTLLVAAPFLMLWLASPAITWWGRCRSPSRRGYCA